MEDVTFINRNRLKSDQILWDLYKLRYRGYIKLAYTITKDTYYAEDVVQDVFAKTSNLIKQMTFHFDNMMHLHAFLYTSVKNRALVILKSKKKLSAFEPDENISELPPMIREAIYKKALFNAVDYLPEDCKEIVVLLLNEFSVRQISEKLKVSISTVKNQKARAISLLRDIMVKGIYRTNKKKPLSARDKAIVKASSESTIELAEKYQASPQEINIAKAEYRQKEKKKAEREIINRIIRLRNGGWPFSDISLRVSLSEGQCENLYNKFSTEVQKQKTDEYMLPLQRKILFKKNVEKKGLIWIARRMRLTMEQCKTIYRYKPHKP